MKKLTKTDAARHLNVSRTTVYNMINRGAIAVDESGLIDVEQLEQVFTPCSGERQGESTNVPVEFRDASPLVLGRYVSYLEQELSRVREEKDRYVTQLEKQIEFLQGELTKTREEVATAARNFIFSSVVRRILSELIAKKPENSEQAFQIIRSVLIKRGKQLLSSGKAIQAQ